MIRFRSWNGEGDDGLEDILLVLIMARYRSQWILVKHKKRGHWEIPGGHREPREPLGLTAVRELIEETGAQDFTITPLALYEVADYYPQIQTDYQSRGALYIAEVQVLPPFHPNDEMVDRRLFVDSPPIMSFNSLQQQVFSYVKNRMT